MKRLLQISEIMNKPPLMVKPTDSVLTVAEKMTKLKISNVLVGEDDVPQGIITTDEITYRVVSGDKSNVKTKAKDIMSADLITIGPTASVQEAIQLLSEEGIKQLPVMDGKDLVGYVTLKDILRVSPELIHIMLDNIRSEEEDRREYIDEFVEKDYIDESLFPLKTTTK